MTYAEMIQKGLITFPTTVDNALKSTIFDWFQYREVCDNEKFNVMFNRVLNQSMRKYNELLRIQPGQPFTIDGVTHYVTYDWLIQNYRESLTQGSVSGTTSGTKTLEKTGGGSDTETTRTTGTVVTDNDTSASNTRTYNEETQTDIDRDISNSSSSSGSSSDNDMSLGKASPQSVSYAGATSGMPSHLDWSYPGSQAESKSTGTTSDTSSGSSEEDTNQNSTHTGTVADSGTGTDDTTVTHNLTVTKTIQHGLDDTDEETSAGTHSEDSESKVLESGRNIATATLLQNAKEFILGSSAWDYLYGRIDTCFQGVTLEW